MVSQILFSTVVYIATSSYLLNIDTTPMLPPFVLRMWVCVVSQNDKDYEISKMTHQKGFVCKFCRIEEMRLFPGSKKNERVIRYFYPYELKEVDRRK